MTADDPGITLDWLAAGERHCRDVVATLTDAGAAGPSGLAGWTRAHLVTHLARNADALVNLLTWARTGTPTPMYPSAGQRDADIAAGAGRSAGQLRSDLVAAADRLAAAVAAMSDDAWRASVRTAQGREIPAAGVPWLRVREVWVHAADLDLGGTLADTPGSVVDALLDEVTATVTARDPEARARLRATDRQRVWIIGRDAGGSNGSGESAGTDPGRPVELAGATWQLLGWLIGRSGPDDLAVSPAGATAPVPPRWI
ncbi:maleylpyruvate isomerase N-terminal domain-containing protein [Solwaraspora sp. WMMB335]|uniref:maleylpyruvate isomerase N-terminal domain-containing protein n=1 Tax=Solwaraspora sp. WMMB335 TaxID=3404118 RepID=UPI003B94BDE8